MVSFMARLVQQAFHQGADLAEQYKKSKTVTAK
jgi:hypothetical protein